MVGLPGAPGAPRHVFYSDLSQAPEEPNAKAWFEELKEQTVEFSKLKAEEAVHRFSNNPCPRETAVKVRIDNEESYLHANTFKILDEEPIILTQYPCGSGHELFWIQTMVKSNLILDLMNEKDLKKKEKGQLLYDRKNYPTGKLNLQPFDVDNALHVDQPLELNDEDKGKLQNLKKELQELSENKVLSKDEIKSKMEAYKGTSDILDAVINNIKTRELLGLEMTFGSMLVTLKDKKVELDNENSPTKIVRYNYTVKNINTDEEKDVSRLHFEGWEDFSGTRSEILKELVELFDAIMSQEFHGIIPLIHCRAGVGRTGTFVTARILIHLANAGKLNKDNFKETLFKIIPEGREQRGLNFVLKDSQLQTLIELGNILC